MKTLLSLAEFAQQCFETANDAVYAAVTWAITSLQKLGRMQHGQKKACRAQVHVILTSFLGKIWPTCLQLPKKTPSSLHTQQPHLKFGGSSQLQKCICDISSGQRASQLCASDLCHVTAGWQGTAICCS